LLYAVDSLVSSSAGTHFHLLFRERHFQKDKFPVVMEDYGIRNVTTWKAKFLQHA
jgi:hypothetical protein